MAPIGSALTGAACPLCPPHMSSLVSEALAAGQVGLPFRIGNPPRKGIRAVPPNLARLPIKRHASRPSFTLSPESATNGDGVRAGRRGNKVFHTSTHIQSGWGPPFSLYFSGISASMQMNLAGVDNGCRFLLRGVLHTYPSSCW